MERRAWKPDGNFWLYFTLVPTEDVNTAFEFLLKLTPLLDKADQRCKYEAPAHLALLEGVLALPALFFSVSARGPSACLFPLAEAGGSYSMVAECPSPCAFPQALTVSLPRAGPHFPPPPPSVSQHAPGMLYPIPHHLFLTAVTVQISYCKNVASRGFCLRQYE